MYPILVDWGSLVLPAWHTFYVLGAVAALLILLAAAQRSAPELPRQDLARLFAICYVTSYFGARLLSIWVEEPEVHGLLGTLSALLTFGPMTFYGGAIAAFVCGLVYVTARRLPLATLLDLALPAGLVALSIGRIGCFLNGDDYGKAAPHDSMGAAPWWTVTFPSLQDGIARYPVQLLEAGTVLLLALVLLANTRRLQQAFRPGVVGFIGIVGYANLRFALEFLRDDFRGSPLGNWLSTSQFISILVLAVAGCTLPFWLTRRKGEPARDHPTYR